MNGAVPRFLQLRMTGAAETGAGRGTRTATISRGRQAPDPALPHKIPLDTVMRLNKIAYKK
jgi:hypothetical protein